MHRYPSYIRTRPEDISTEIVISVVMGSTFHRQPFLWFLLLQLLQFFSVESTSSFDSSSHRHATIFLDVDNTLYRESSLPNGIESQIIQGIHRFCRDALNLTAAQADNLHRTYGSTVEGLSQTVWKDTDSATQQKHLQSFYDHVYETIDVRELVLAHAHHPGSSISSTGYSHASSSKGRQPNMAQLRRILQQQSSSSTQFILASNSPKVHVQTIVQALGLCRVSGGLGLLTPDFPQEEQSNHKISSASLPFFPTKARPLAFFSSERLNNNPTISSTPEPSSSCLIDDSATVLQAVASELHDGMMTPIQVIHPHQSLEKALAITLGWIDPEFIQMDDAQYLKSKNQVDFRALHRPTWHRFLGEMVQSMASSEQRISSSSLTIADLGAGLLSMLELLLNGHGDGDLLSLGQYMQERQANHNLLTNLERIDYHAYEPNEALAPDCIKKMESMGFVVQKDNGGQSEQRCDDPTSNQDPPTANRIPRTTHFFRPPCDSLPAIRVEIVFDDYRELLQTSGSKSTISPDVVIGACFADLYEPSELVRSILACFLGRPEPHQQEALVYFPITFGGTTQFLPPQPAVEKLPSDTEAFRLYAQALTEELGHNLDSDKMVEELENFGGQVLSQGPSDWVISPKEHPYLWNCMMYFFGTTAAPSIEAAGYDACAWMNRARTSQPVIQASNKDFLVRLPFLGRWKFPTAASLPANGKSDHSLLTHYEEIQFTAPRQVQVVQKPSQALGPNDVRIQSVCSLVSSGTELKIFKGEFEDAALDVNIPSMQEERMAYPLSYGYCLVGRIVECGSSLADGKESLVGKMVFAFAAHSSQVVVDRSAIQIVPDGIDPYDAIFMPSVETAVAIVHDAHVRYGERVAVFGQGLIGLLVTAVLRESNTLVTSVDTIPARLAASAMMGATQALLPTEVSKTDPFDLAIEVSGNYRALQSAIDQTMDHGRVILGSWYGSEKVQLKLDMDFHRSHKSFIVSQVSEIPPALTGTWSKSRRFGLAWALVRKLRPSRLLTRTLPLSEAQEVYTSLEKGHDLAIAFNLEKKNS